jgi:short-subunit dehydrogenase
MEIAVVTGASSGMGREFVYALDRQHKFDEIWVLARREERLRELQKKVRARIRPIPCDLLRRESIRGLREPAGGGKAQRRGAGQRGGLRPVRHV